MANINNLNTPSVPKLERRVSQVESGAPMNNAGVGRSGFEVYDQGTINVSNGNIIGAGTFSWQGSFSQSGTSILSGSTTIAGPTGITGTLTIQGATSVAGDFTVTGPTKLNGVTDIGGNTKVTGTFDVEGAMATKGTLSVEGVTTLKNDLNVTTGKVKVGTMTLDPSIADGAMTFGNGSQVFTDGSSVQLFKGNGSFKVDGGATWMQWGGNSLLVNSTGVRIPNPSSTTNAANVYMDQYGYIYRKN